MRDHSVYTFQCRCGADLECEEKETICTKCGVLIRLVWPMEKNNETNN